MSNTEVKIKEIYQITVYYKFSLPLIAQNFDFYNFFVINLHLYSNQKKIII